MVKGLTWTLLVVLIFLIVESNGQQLMIWTEDFFAGSVSLQWNANILVIIVFYAAEQGRYPGKQLSERIEKIFQSNVLFSFHIEHFPLCIGFNFHLTFLQLLWNAKKLGIQFHILIVA